MNVTRIAPNRLSVDVEFIGQFPNTFVYYAEKEGVEIRDWKYYTIQNGSRHGLGKWEMKAAVIDYLVNEAKEK